MRPPLLTTRCSSALRHSLQPFAVASPSEELLDYKLTELCHEVRRKKSDEVMERLRGFAGVVYADDEPRRTRFVKEAGVM